MTRTISFIVLFALMLAGCATGPATPDLGSAPPAQMPDLPDALKKRAQPLPPITDATLGGIHKDGMNTDMAYNDLAHRYNAVLDAWECVKKGLNERDPEATERCLKD